MVDITRLKPWRVYKFPWGSALKHASGRWERLYLHPDGQEVDVSKLDVVLSDAGIKFK
jgi:hypothetical protein